MHGNKLFMTYWRLIKEWRVSKGLVVNENHVFKQKYANKRKSETLSRLRRQKSPLLWPLNWF